MVIEHLRYESELRVSRKGAFYSRIRKKTGTFIDGEMNEIGTFSEKDEQERSAEDDSAAVRNAKHKP